MSQCILYNHGGSDNHGCEAIVRTTVKLLEDANNSVILSSLRPDADYAECIDKICPVVKQGSKKAKRDLLSLDWWKSYITLKLKKDPRPLDAYYKFVDLKVKTGDIAMSIGGDNYCYGGTAILAARNSFFRQHGLKTVLWGCSVEPSVLSDTSIAKDIAGFDCILARESISYNALRQINSNTHLVCDPAFLLETTYRPLPSHLKEKEYVGINLSPLIEKSEKIPGITRKNCEALIEYILNYTSYNILLFPHVICDWDDDRTVLGELFLKYQSSGRVLFLENMSCTDIKGYIARSRFIITARTHASIAAYSSRVPTIVLGYSVKSKGIARDLFGSEDGYVVPVQDLIREDELVERFLWLEQNEQRIIDHLTMVLPDYINRIVIGAELVKKL